MTFIELLKEIDRVGAFFFLWDKELVLYLPPGHCLPDSLRICIKRHKEALIDREKALAVVRVGDHPFEGWSN